jgi:hypothetical protein
MKRPYTELEVWSLLQVAAQQLTVERGASKPSISSLCRHAKISRAHLYATFPQLVAKLRAPRQAKLEWTLAERLAQLESENKELQRANAMLARSCLELKLSILKIEQLLSKSRGR